MNIFTFLLEIDGGTYICQVDANSVQESVTRWPQKLESEDIPFLKEKENLKVLLQEVSDELPLLLIGLTSVWCISCSVDEKLALINIVKTAI